MNKIPYEERKNIYLNALCRKGVEHQCIVAIEELSECQKEICKILRGGGDLDHLAEEVADATIVLEQIRIIFDLNYSVSRKMDEKVQRLDDRLRAESCGGTGDG